MRYEVHCVWDVEAESEAEANTVVWDCIDGHTGIVQYEVVRTLEIAEEHQHVSGAWARPQLSLTSRSELRRAGRA